MEQLKKLLLIMLSSDQPGEITNAAVMIKRWLVKNKKDVHWLVDQLVSPSQAPAPRQQSQPATQWGDPFADIFRQAQPIPWQEMLIYVADRRQHLKIKEIEFIQSLLNQSLQQGWAPSPKQHGWLASIYQKLRNYGI